MEGVLVDHQHPVRGLDHQVRVVDLNGPDRLRRGFRVRGRWPGPMHVYRQGLTVGRKPERLRVHDLPSVLVRELHGPLALSPAGRSSATRRAPDRMVLPVECDAFDGALPDERKPFAAIRLNLEFKFQAEWLGRAFPIAGKARRSRHTLIHIVLN